MSYGFNQSDVEAALAKSVESGELRKILDRQGIQQDEPVKLSIKVDDKGVITDYEIPIVMTPVAFAQTQTDFKQEMRNFLNEAQTAYGLLTAIYPYPINDGEHIRCNFIFDSQNSEPLEYKSGIGQCHPFIC